MFVYIFFSVGIKCNSDKKIVEKDYSHVAVSFYIKWLLIHLEIITSCPTRFG